MPKNNALAAWLPLLAFITVSVAWGTTYAAIKVAVETVPPFLMAGVRFLIAGGVLLAVLRWKGVALPTRRECAWLALVGVLLLATANTLVGFAEQYLDSAFAALVVNASPFIFVGLMVASGERVPLLAWIGLTIGFGGMVVLVSPELRALITGSSENLHHPMFWWSVLALLGGSTSWAVGSWIAAKRPVKAHHLMIIAVQNVAGGAAALSFSIFSGEAFRAGAPSTNSILAVAYLIVVGSWLGYVAYIYCVMNLPAQRTATTTYINNVVAIGVGWLFLGEVISREMIIGGAVILLGVWIVNTAKNRRPAAPASVPAEPGEPAAAEA